MNSISNMKIYFAGSIRGGREDTELYGKIVALLANYGIVLTEHLADSKISSYGETHMSNNEIYNRDIMWLKESDVVIAEVTIPSLGVGYEIGFAEALGKKVIILYRPSDGKRLSAMLSGNKKCEYVEYSDISELSAIFDALLK